MCTRKQAIACVVSDKSGSIKTLRNRIGDFYDTFVMLGIIEEILPDPDNDNADSDNWVATDIAVQNAVLFGIEP